MKHYLEMLVIRKITHNDLPDLEWEGEFKHFRRLYINAFQNQQNGTAVLWVAELPKAGIIGQVFVQLSGSRPELADGQFRAYIYSVRIKRLFRNLGIGTKIMRHAEQDILQRGYSVATLNVGKQNVKACRFYQRLGYQIISEEPGNWSYLDHHGKRRYVHEPSWRMHKQLKLA
jgi:ribosomal protein S18 acetylase RimI-like enzyme